MREVISINIGQAGIQSGNACWEVSNGPARACARVPFLLVHKQQDPNNIYKWRFCRKHRTPLSFLHGLTLPSASAPPLF